ncbi:MAG TPA: hypothetical protein VHM93_04480 [Candidatus Acidoferrum sp.]|nr:hypothetical protein [Candidatus Acidoferrum sp.]
MEQIIAKLLHEFEQGKLYLFTVRASVGMVQEGLSSGRTARGLRMRWRG